MDADKNIEKFLKEVDDQYDDEEDSDYLDDIDDMDNDKLEFEE